MREIKLNLKRSEVYEEGAKLITVLAYPDPTEPKSILSNMQTALCAHAIRSLAEEDANWKNTPQRIKPLHALLPADDVTKALDRLETPLKARTAAGKMAIAYVRDASKALGVLPEGVPKLTRTALAEKFGNESDPDNVVKRSFRPSLPVIHMAAALEYLEEAHTALGNSRHSVLDLLRNRGILRYLVDCSNQFADHLLDSAKLKLAPEDVIRFRLS
jgi:hypothetical protein